ncbi:MAG: hypothetical protein SNJ71_00050 [Bacteroidales bacterium]
MEIDIKQKKELEKKISAIENDMEKAIEANNLKLYLELRRTYYNLCHRWENMHRKDRMPVQTVSVYKFLKDY